MRRGDFADAQKELNVFKQKALDAQPRADASEHPDAVQLRQLSELGLLFSGAVPVPDDAVQFVSVAATRIQATFRGYRARAAGQRPQGGEMQ